MNQGNEERRRDELAAARPDPYGVFKRWMEVKAGSNEHEPDDFMFFLNDMHPDLFDELFGELPNGGEFIGRLNRMISDHLDVSTLDVAHAGTDRNQLTMRPREDNRLPPDDLVEIARRDLRERTQVLRHAGKDEDARRIDGAPVTFLADRSSRSLDFVWFREVMDWLAQAETVTGLWLSCLKESAIQLTGQSTTLHPWLFKQWLDLPVDFEPTYELWKAGGAYGFDGDTIFVVAAETHH